MKTCCVTSRFGPCIVTLLVLVMLGLWAFPSASVAQDERAPAPPTPDETPDPPAPASPSTEAAPADGAAATQPAVQTAAPGLIPAGAKLGVIRIEGLIYDFTLESLRRRVDKAMDHGVDAIVIEINTKGGVVTSALDIAQYIKGQITVPTVAWINSEAYSAGILIASACDEIVMSPASATGDCAPIVPGQNLDPTERAKALSPILEAFRDNAASNGYEYVLFHAMCVLGVEVYEIEHAETGARRMVNQLDKAVLVDGASSGPGFFSRFFGGSNPQAQNEPGGVSLSPRVEEERGQWNLVRQVHDGKTLLTLSQDRAYDVGLASSKDIRTQADLIQHYGAASGVTIDPTWSESLAGWLTSPGIRAILILAVLLGAYAEFQSPGLGIPGLVSVSALILLLGAPFLVGLADIWPVILFFIGFVLIIVEVFVTPGFGLPGITGVMLMVVGLVMQVVPTGGGFVPPPGAWERAQASALWTIASLIVSTMGMAALIAYLPSAPVARWLTLEESQASLGDAPPMPVSGDVVTGSGLIQVGDKGMAVGQLRPIGRMTYHGHEIDVVSTGAWIDNGTPLRVVEVRGNRIVVEADEDELFA